MSTPLSSDRQLDLLISGVRGAVLFLLGPDPSPEERARMQEALLVVAEEMKQEDVQLMDILILELAV